MVCVPETIGEALSIRDFTSCGLIDRIVEGNEMYWN